MSAPLAGTAASSRCVPFVCRRGEQQRTRAQAQAPSPAPAGQGCGWPIGRAAGLVGGGIAAAFFASLERCSCVEVRTTDDLADHKAGPGRDHAEAALLIHDAGAGRSTAAKSKRTSSAGAGASARKGRRGSGFGCCENIN